METSADEAAWAPHDRLWVLGAKNGLLSAAFIVPASLVLKSTLPLALALTAGLVLWAAASAFLMVGILLVLTAYKASKRLSPLVAVLALPVVAATLIAVV